VGSGPAGLAAADQLNRAGHSVTVFEKSDRIGGLLRYGIPEFKMEKRHLDRRVEQMEAEGTTFRTNANVGENVPVSELDQYDAVVLAGGATAWRDLPVPGRELKGIYQAMEYLPWGNRYAAGEITESPISAEGKAVVIIGGGDTGADCLGTAIRQKATSVHQFEIMPRPPDERTDAMPWPTYPMIYRVASAHEEGVERVYAVNTECFVGDDDGNVKALRAHEVEQKFEEGRMSFEKVEGSDFDLEAELVLLAMGFVGPQRPGLLEQLGVDINERGNVTRDDRFRTSKDNVFVCGDMGRGQSLIVWAIAEGRACAAAVDESLMGQTLLPAPITPDAVPMR
jgi:glutamate synthase (NADPH/NADH) small chain